MQMKLPTSWDTDYDNVTTLEGPTVQYCVDIILTKKVTISRVIKTAVFMSSYFN